MPVVEYDYQDVGDIESGIVRFTADWCMPCKQYKPVFDKAASRFDDVNFYVVNIEEYPDLAAEHNIMSIPAVFRVRDRVWQRFKEIPGAQQLHATALGIVDESLFA